MSTFGMELKCSELKIKYVEVCINSKQALCSCCLYGSKMLVTFSSVYVRNLKISTTLYKKKHMLCGNYL